MNYSFADIAQRIGATLVYCQQNTQKDGTVNGLATLASAQAGQIAFMAHPKYRKDLIKTKASVVILNPKYQNDCPTNVLLMDNPYLGYAMVAQLLDTTPSPATQIHPTAVIGDDVTLGKNVAIGANTVIESGCVIADNVSIGAGCFIGEGVVIGENCSIWANVTLYHRIEMGHDCLIQANTVIGSDGFGYANEQGHWQKIPQLGTVIIGNKVEIGASTTIDRGALDNTIIGNGVILDNQIQIAHNVVIGDHTAMAACSVVAGSTVIGKHCSISGLVGINGHIEITDGCTVTGHTMVAKSISEPGIYSSGTPAMTNRQWNKTTARLKKLDDLNNRVASLEKQPQLMR